MKIESKISGWAITDFDIVPLNRELTLGDYLKLSERTKKIIGENYYTYLDNCKTLDDIFTILDLDDRCKFAILESYPNYEKELVDYFGDNWLNYYLRFNH